MTDTSSTSEPWDESESTSVALQSVSEYEKGLHPTCALSHPGALFAHGRSPGLPTFLPDQSYQTDLKLPSAKMVTAAFYDGLQEQGEGQGKDKVRRVQ